MASIPQTNPKANYLAHKNAIDIAVSRVLDSGWYILGSEVRAFEREYAEYIGIRYAIGVASGTDALLLALRACGVGQGDSVLTVSHTAVATVSAIVQCGASPVFVDIHPDDFTMDPNHLEDTIRSSPDLRLKAIIPVHLYGHPADMAAIADIAKRHGLHVVEDCAQSHGATYRGKKTGTLGHMGAFSYYPTKNLGAVGDGGMVVTDDPELSKKVLLLREYGWKDRYISQLDGFNSRLDEIQAAILRVKLPFLEKENRARREIAETYIRRLSGTNLTLPKTSDEVSHAYHQFVIRCDRRDELRSHLLAAGIATLIHYPVPVHLQPAYSGRGHRGARLPNTEDVATKILSLPMFPELTADDVQRVTEKILSWCKG